MKNKYRTDGDITIIYCEYKDSTVEFRISTGDLGRVMMASSWNILKKPEGTLYVQGRRQGSQSRVLLHRYIMEPSSDMVVDHIDRNPLNNTRDNLRVVTQFDNMKNRGVSNRTGHSGIYLENGRYVAKIGVNNKSLYLGMFKTLEEAIKARKKGEAKYW
jgi:hypothetical protein